MVFGMVSCTVSGRVVVDAGLVRPSVESTTVSLSVSVVVSGVSTGMVSPVCMGVAVADGGTDGSTETVDCEEGINLVASEYGNVSGRDETSDLLLERAARGSTDEVDVTSTSGCGRPSTRGRF